MSIRSQSFDASLNAELKKLSPEELRATAAALLSNSLLDFSRECWSVIEPEPFSMNLCWEVMCDYLEAITLGITNRLLINVPPRHGKSTLVSVIWPCWEWSRDNGKTKWIFCSSSESLSIRDSVKRRNLLQSGFFRFLWPNVVIADDMNLKGEYSTTNNGSMYSTWIGGALGRGANRLVIDDPHSPADMYSDASRESTVKFIRGSLFSRLDNPARDAIVIAHARVHTDDITGTLLDPDRGDDSPRPNFEETVREGVSETVMEAPVTPQPDRPRLVYNPRICGYSL
jgi:hypothetical protein